MSFVKGLNALGADNYFIRLKDRPGYYLHLEKESAEDLTYRVCKGEVGACIWHKEEGEAFIEQSGAQNLELVKVTDILKPDGSSN